MCQAARWIVVLLLVVATGCRQRPATLSEEYDEQKMEAAIGEARATLDTFLSRARQPQEGDSGFVIKVAITDKHGTEHFWLVDLELAKEPFAGTIDNEPGVVRNVKVGQRYSFARADVSDWMYFAKGKAEGGYTTRVLLESSSSEEREMIKQALGW